MLSALTLLRTDDDPQRRANWSYVSLVEEVRRVSSQPRLGAPEQFRRMCFNALISNIDDHPRNHAMVAMDSAQNTTCNRVESIQVSSSKSMKGLIELSH